MIILGVPVLILIVLIFIIMENASTSSGQETRASAKDFFLNLGAIVALYAIVISLLNLLFRVINVAFPQTNTYGFFGSQSISLPVATLIIVFPIFIFLMWFMEKGFVTEPAKRYLAVRKWLSYITLFIAGIILAGDLVTVLYYFLDGQELTAGFLLKVLSVFVIAIIVFLYYISDIRGKLTGKSRKIWFGISAVVILLSIIWGFSVLGSPRTQRLMKYDSQKVSDLQNLGWQVINYWQANGMIPDSLPNITSDKQTGRPYEYIKTGAMTFELCAGFNLPSQTGQNTVNGSPAYLGIKGAQNDDWSHPEGKYCFSREIDPVAYPTRIKG